MLTTQAELARLVIQARAWAPAATALLGDVGVEPGWVCADLGCGPSGILGLLARRVGRRGRVVGVDLDAGALLAALTASARLPNVSLVPAPVTRTGLPGGTFDLVHGRLICQGAGAGPLLDEMIRLAKPGGVIVLQEPGPELWEIDPAPPRYEAVARRVAAVFLRRRLSTGPALPDRFRRLGLRNIRFRQHRLRFRGGHPYAAMPLFALQSAEPALLEAGVLSRREFAELSASLAAAAESRVVRHHTFPLWQVWGRVAGGRRYIRA